LDDGWRCTGFASPAAQMKHEPRYVTETRSRRLQPANPKRWYQCACGLWWGKNKHFRCHCGALPPVLVRARLKR
jgi:hypothetical protein